MDKKKSFLKTFVINSLRRASYRWPERNEAMKAARVERGLYKCKSCEALIPNKEVKIDHINPVVSLSGFTTWDDYINRMFCNSEDFQILCNPCHDIKTSIEIETRKLYRQLKKKELTQDEENVNIKDKKEGNSEVKEDD